MGLAAIPIAAAEWKPKAVAATQKLQPIHALDRDLENAAMFAWNRQISLRSDDLSAGRQTRDAFTIASPRKHFEKSSCRVEPFGPENRLFFKS